MPWWYASSSSRTQVPPGKVQNEAVPRMLQSFPELGVDFAK